MLNKNDWSYFILQTEEEGKQTYITLVLLVQFQGLNCKTKLSQNNTLLPEFHPVPSMSTNSFTQHPHPAGLELLLCYKTATQVLVRTVLQHPPCYKRQALPCPRGPNTWIPLPWAWILQLSPAQLKSTGSSTTKEWNTAISSPYNLPGCSLQLHKDLGSTSAESVWHEGFRLSPETEQNSMKDIYRSFKSSR